MTDRDRQRRERLELAREIAQQAGTLTLRYFGDPTLRVEQKADQSPVTAADRESERLLRSAITHRFPQDSITGEEFGVEQRAGPFHWILDPIDGTKAFVCGVPLYGTLVAVWEENRPLIGVIHLPALRESVWAMIGEGATHQGPDGSLRVARVSDCRTLADAIFLTSERRSFDHCSAAPAYAILEATCRTTRTWGDCYGYLLVATGRADVMIDPQLQIWDAAAMIPILSEAGGQFTDWQGRVAAETGNGVGTNGHLLPRLLEVLSGGPSPNSPEVRLDSSPCRG